jgi:O-antigen/teichoic acid export membrane protein
MSRIAGILSLVRLRAFDTDSERGRSLERYRRASLTSAAAIAAKIVSVVTAFVTVPLALNYLGSDRYGMWLTISSISLMLGFADLGIGNGVLNAVTEANGRDDRIMGREAVSSGLFLLSLIAVGLIAVFAVVNTFVPWAHVYNVTSPDAMREAGPATAVFVLVWALNIPLDIVQRVQLGYQRGFINYAWQAAGSLIALGGAILAIQLNARLPWLVLALTGGPLLAVFLNGVVEFGFARTWLRPAWRFVKWIIAARILHLGVLFFVIQLAMTFSYASDNIVIAQVLGSPEVPQYAVPARLFAFIGVLVAMLIAPLWPAYGEALTRGDVPWVKRTLSRTLVLTLVLTGIPAVTLVVFGRSLIHIWVGDTVNPSASLLVGLAVWTLLGGLASTVSIFLNGANILRFQAVCAVLLAVGALALKVVFARAWGVAGVPWALVLSTTVFVALPMVVYVPFLLGRMTRADFKDGVDREGGGSTQRGA